MTKIQKAKKKFYAKMNVVNQNELNQPTSIRASSVNDFNYNEKSDEEDVYR